MAQAADVGNAAVDVVFRKSVGVFHHFVVEREFRGDEGRVKSGGDFQRTARFGAVASHARQGVDHVLDGETNLLETAVLQITNARGHTDRRIHNAAKRRQSADALFDVDGE